MARFEKITKYKDIEFDMPQRKTKGSAGYDFVAVEDTIVPSYFLQLSKMIIAQLEKSELKKLIEETEYGKIFKNIQDIKQEEVQDLVQNYFPEVLEIMKESFSLNLNDMKTLIKESKNTLTLVPTGIKAYMDEDQSLELAIRSSIPMNNFIVLGNGVGLVDSDYVDNIDNEGHIFFQVINLSPFNITIQKGDIIGQGVFRRYEVTEDDVAGGIRIGGHGSTSK